MGVGELLVGDGHVQAGHDVRGAFVGRHHRDSGLLHLAPHARGADQKHPRVRGVPRQVQRRDVSRAPHVARRAGKAEPRQAGRQFLAMTAGVVGEKGNAYPPRPQRIERVHRLRQRVVASVENAVHVHDHVLDHRWSDLSWSGAAAFVQGCHAAMLMGGVRPPLPTAPAASRPPRRPASARSGSGAGQLTPWSPPGAAV